MEGRTIQRPASLGFRERMLGPVQGKQQIVNNCTGNEDRPPPPPPKSHLFLQKTHKRNFHSHMSVSLQVTGMIPMAHMGNPEGEH